MIVPSLTPKYRTEVEDGRSKVASLISSLKQGTDDGKEERNLDSY